MSILFVSTYLVVSGQHEMNSTPVDSTNFNEIYPHALRGEMTTVFKILNKADDLLLTSEQKELKDQYHSRFLYRNENFEFNTSDAEIIDLFKRLQNYWRSVMIENVPLRLADSLLRDEMRYYLKKHIHPEPTMKEINRNYYQMFQDFFKSKNMHAIALGKTGHLFDLYLWKEEEEKQYDIDLPEGQSVSVPIVFMRDFISNGWSHYTTFGHSFSGGWATRDKLFCVEESYGSKDDEEFLVSYISHEGQHFADYKIFPKLKQTDLEFRAKLTELALSKTSTYDILKKFIRNAKEDKSYAHAFANYTVIDMFSKELLNTDFESNIDLWKKAPDGI